MVVGLTVMFALTRVGGAGASPTLTAEAVDTENGVVLMAHAQNFPPDTDLNIYWHDGAAQAVHARTSPEGEVLAAISLPPSMDAGMDHAAMGGSATLTDWLHLIASDGRREASLTLLPAPASSVLAATQPSRIIVNGRPYFLLGANYPWANYGNDFGSNAWGSYGVHAGGSFAADFADMKAKGVHVARWWVFGDGRAGISFSADGTPLSVQPAALSDLDAALALAQQNNIYLDLVLFDFSLVGPSNVVNGVQMGGHRDVIADATKRAALVNNVITPLAKRYASNPMILSWELMNEPEWAIGDLPGPAVQSGYNPISMAQFWSFGSSASQIIHLYAKQQVTVGSAALKWNRVWTNAFATKKGLPALNLDFYQTHYYQWMDCCSTNNDPDLGTTTWSPLTQNVSALGLDRPIVVGEIHTPTGSGASQLDKVLANGFAGFWGWSYRSQSTGDHMLVDWAGFTPWESAHAAIARIVPPVTTVPTVVVPKTPTTPPSPTRPAISTPTKPAAPTATATKPAVPPTATATKPSVATATRPAVNTPTKTNTAPAATNTTAATATRTSAPPPPTATRTTAPTPTKTAAPASTPAAVAFGRTTAAGFNDTADWGYLNGTSASLPVSGKLTQLAVYVGSTAPTAHIRLALYGDGGGKPGNLLAQTNPANAQTGWNVLGTTSALNLTAGTYWIVAQTDDASTVYRMADGLTPSSALGWTPMPYGSFPTSAGGWTSVGDMAFSMYGTVMATGSPSAPTGVGAGAATATIPMSVPTGEAPTSIPTSTSAPGTATPVPPTATATTRPPTSTPTTVPGGFEQSVCPTKRDPSGMQSQCGSSVGNGDDYHFCDRWSGGFCDDFRGDQHTTEVAFPGAGDPYSADCVSTTDGRYTPSMGSSGDVMPQLVPFPCAFTANEHMMTRMEDGSFGDLTIRLQQPFDFASRTGHIHFDVDLKTSTRTYVRLTLSPQLTKRGTDDRDGPTGGHVVFPNNGLDVWLQGGHIGLTKNQGGGCGMPSYCVQSLAKSGDVYNGHDNVRDHVDVYVSRTHIKFVIANTGGGTQTWETDIPDMGFDRAYVYFQQASYNTCKDRNWPDHVWPNGTLDLCSVDAQMYHWDNIAFDGPVLPLNQLTPANFEDVVFNALSVSHGNTWDGGYSPGVTGDCTVKGVAASPTGPGVGGAWSTWVARLPAGTAVSTSDIQCLYTGWPSATETVQGLEIVRQ